jgi:hypothetical protein
VTVHAVLPQEILKSPKFMCICNLCYSWNSEEAQNLCACATDVTSGNPEESQVF